MIDVSIGRHNHVELAVLVEVAESHGNGCYAHGDETCRLEGSIAIAQQD